MDKKAQRSRVNVMNLLQKTQYSWNIFFFRASVINRRTQNFTIIDQEKQNRTNLHLEPHDYRINYVNIDLRHEYGIYAAKAQTSLIVKRP